jgi:hypothetical protein
MPATAETIGFCLSATRIATSGPDSGVVAKYGDTSRTTDEPLETFFDAVADVQAVCDARLELLKADRRRLPIDIRGEATGLSFDYKGTTPSATIIDDERALNKVCAIVEFGIDFERGQTAVVSWG